MAELGKDSFVIIGLTVHLQSKDQSWSNSGAWAFEVLTGQMTMLMINQQTFSEIQVLFSNRFFTLYHYFHKKKFHIESCQKFNTNSTHSFEVEQRSKTRIYKYTSKSVPRSAITTFSN